MQENSLVICINPDHFSLINLKRDGNQTPEAKTIYTVREIDEDEWGNTCIRLYEIFNPILKYPSGSVGEACFSIQLFKEIQEPMEISELIKMQL